MKNLTLALSMLFSSIVTASDNTQTQVNYAGVRGDGVVFINLNKTINETNCPQTSVFLGPDISDAIKNQVLSVAMTAYVAQKNVYVKTDGCYLGYPTFSATSKDSWIHIFDPS